MEKTKHYKGHRWTEEEIRLLMKLWSENKNLQDISIELKITQVALLKQIQRLRQNGIPLAKRRAGHVFGNINRNWTSGEVEYLIRRRNEKASSEEIGSELGRSPNAVDAMIQKLRKENINVAMRGSGVRRLWDVESLRALLMTDVLSNPTDSTH